MTTPTEKMLLRLEWTVLRRLEGRLQGTRRTVHRGAGVDFAGLRGYLEGDDARHIDWNVTARLDEPHVRVFTEDRELTVWLVLDTSASMGAGAPGRTKERVAAELTLVIARLFGRSGDRVGAILFDGAGLRVVPPGIGRGHVLRIGREFERAVEAPGATTDLAAMLEAAARTARRPALVVVVSDFIGTGEWERALLRLARRHETAVLRIVDGADESLPDAGLLVVEDAETGEQLVVDSSDPLFRARFTAGVEARDELLAAGARRAGVPLHRVPTDRDPTESLVGVVASTRVGRR